MMQGVSSLNQDYVASYLRCQIATLTNLLENIEFDRYQDIGYFVESIRRVEIDLKRVRSFLEN